MRVNGISRFSGLALVAGMVVAMLGVDAMAWSNGSWGSSGSYGSSGSSASYGSSGSSASYGSYGRVGLFGRMRARRAARRASYGSYGSSASYGSYGSSGSFGSHGSSGSYGTPVYSEPADATTATGNTSIQVALPVDAKVYVNDAPTTSTGTERSYVSRGLRQGMTYSYKIRVEYEQDSRTITEEKLVKLSAGETISLTFGQTEEEAMAEVQADEPVKTEVKVQVPKNATVFLSGSQMKQTGKLRTFSTSQLAAGQEWEDYTVRVEINRDGQTLVREKTLTVVGGGSYELAFDFDSTATAQLAQLDK